MSTTRMNRRFLIVLVALLSPAICLAASRRASRDSWQQPDRVVADLGLKDGSTIADVGCGTGYFTFRLAKAVGASGKVYATEISSKSLKAVSDRVAKDKIANVKTILSEPTATKLEPDCVDAALICNVLHHVPKEQRPALVKDVIRAIKPGGFFYIVDWRVDAKVGYDLNRRIPRDELLKLGTDAGLKLDAEYYYLVNQVFFRFRKPKSE